MQFRIFSLIVMGLLLFACSDSGNPVNSDNPDNGESWYDANIQPVFSANCSGGGCHTGPGATGLDLSAGNSYAALVGVQSSNYGTPRVEAGNAVNSVLWHKLSDSGTFGDVMPPGGGLAQATVSAIETWINDGAEFDIEE